MVVTIKLYKYEELSSEAQESVSSGRQPSWFFYKDGTRALIKRNSDGSIYAPYVDVAEEDLSMDTVKTLISNIINNSKAENQFVKAQAYNIATIFGVDVPEDYM